MHKSACIIKIACNYTCVLTCICIENPRSCRFFHSGMHTWSYVWGHAYTERPIGSQESSVKFVKEHKNGISKAVVHVAGAHDSFVV